MINRDVIGHITSSSITNYAQMDNDREDENIYSLVHKLIDRVFVLEKRYNELRENFEKLLDIKTDEDLVNFLGDFCVE